LTSRYSIEAYRGDAPFAFVSYAHEDAERVFEELGHLRDAGLRFYYDEGIHPGHAWHDDLAAAIERCAVFVIFLTERSVQSRNCLRELTFALDRGREVIAVHLDPVTLPSGLQLALGDRQAILRHRFDEAAYRARLVDAVRAFVNARESVPAARESAPAPAAPPPRSTGRRRWPVVVAVVTALAVLAAGVWLSRSRALEAEREAANYSAFVRAARADDAIEAYRFAQALSETQRAGEEFRSLWSAVTSEVELAIATPDAQVAFRPYATSADAGWIPLGRTPFADQVTLPNGVLELRLEKAGHATNTFAVRVPGPLARPEVDESAALGMPRPGSMQIELAPVGAVDDAMVRVPDSDVPVFVPGWTPEVFGGFAKHVPAFAVAKREVSNREFQDFVDAGGYDEESLWQGLAVARGDFVDSTGRPGPAQWSLGRFPEGEGDLPVTGVSWYEAVAYARFRDAQLPTIHHWARYAMGPWEGFALVGPAIAGAGNFDLKGAETTNAERALGPWGTFDTAGNVREWLWNAAGDAQLAMGGGWNDYSSNHNLLMPLEGTTHSPMVGLRLMRTLSGSGIAADLLDPIEPISLDIAQRKPVSDDAFEIMRAQFSAQPRKPVSVSIEEIDGTDTWRLERHELQYADGATFRVYVVKPMRQAARYQAIVYCPHGGATVPRAAERLRQVLSHALTVVRTGRWVFMPEWTGTLTKVRPFSSDETEAEMLERQRRGAHLWYQESIDTLAYIAAFEEIDQAAIGLLSESYGSVVMAPMLLALQPQYKAAVLISAGVVMRKLHPMVDMINYLPRVTRPVLMVNGRYDPSFPYDASQRPFFETLGSAAADKRVVLYEGGHFYYPPNQLAAEISAWYDRYLGVGS
jgi:hypothetical protein